MSDYDNTNRGVLFKNDRKDTEKHPDYKGNINVNGTEMWLSAWIREGAKGKFMSLSVQPKDQQSQPSARQSASNQSSAGLADMDSDTPF